MARPQHPRIPPELVGLVAKFTADIHHTQRAQSLKACMLTCRCFAQEFRRYLFGTLCIHEGYWGSPQRARRLLEARYDILLNNPDYVVLVKRVSILVSNDDLQRGQLSLGNHPTFAKLLNLLPSVTAFVLRSTYANLSYPCFSPASGQAIRRLCSLTSITWLAFDDCTSLPASLFLASPNLQELQLKRTKISREEGDFALAPTTQPLHLSLLGQWPMVGLTPSFLKQVEWLSVEVPFTGTSAVRMALEQCIGIRQLECRVDDLSRLKHLSHIHLWYQNGDLRDLSKYISSIISSTGTSETTSPLERIEVTYVNRQAGSERSEWAGAEDFTTEQLGALPRLELFQLHIIGAFSRRLDEVVSQWAKGMFPSLPPEKRQVSYL
ncbi:hypothetical protein BKA70DRAFT_1526789 [Coprinopsis sp. MPI-PUGE-AT-0042]|nr:hypothetical protein BKA70DRAFT_1526789 [Coprinopsis sp. MPI-PUGE-AT-0042]